jgi:transcriptional regulator with XRE-family HTH domain
MGLLLSGRFAGLQGSGRTAGELLTRARVDAGLTQAQMAERVGVVTQQTLSRLERDEYEASIAVMERAAAAVGLRFVFGFERP